MLETINWFTSLFLNTPTEVIVLVLGAGGVSLLVQCLKKWWHLENERWIFLLVTTITLAGSSLDWFLSADNLPVTIIGVQTTLLLGIAQTLYIYVIKPLNLILAGYKSNREAIKAKLAEVEIAEVPKDINTLKDAEKVVSAIKEAAPAITVPMAQAVAKTPETAAEGAIVPQQPVEPPRPVATF